MTRTANINRKTKETDISLSLSIDGAGSSEIYTGIGFFDHMLSGFTKHGFFNLTVQVNGDLDVDGHHTVEDTGIVLGTAIREAIGDKTGIKRYGSFILPMDDALCLCAVDLCGRPYFAYDCEFKVQSGRIRHGTCERVFLCGVLQRRNESSHQDVRRLQRASYDRGDV